MRNVLLNGLSAISITFISWYLWRNKKKFIRNKNHQVEFSIHNGEIGRVVGKSGKRIKDIIRRCSVEIKFYIEDYSSDYCLCVIEGEKNRVEKAQRIIIQILEQCTDISFERINKDAFAVSNKLNESSIIEDDGNNDDFLQKSLLTDYITDHTQKLDSCNNDGFIPVYVSAVATPDSFWVQSIKTKEHIELDRLTEELYDYYTSHEEMNVSPHYSDVKTGYICATYSIEDDRWYRTEVAEVSQLNEPNVNETIIDLYFLDYGVSSYQKIKNLRKLPSKFLDLKFQAIKCGLAHIKSVGETWSEDSLSFFEDLTHVGQWCTLMARIDYENEDGHPQLTLINTNSGEDINLADEMVNRGYAKYSLM